MKKAQNVALFSKKVELGTVSLNPIPAKVPRRFKDFSNLYELCLFIS